MDFGELIAFVWDRSRAFVLAERSVHSFVTLLVVFSIALLLELVTRQPWRARYSTRNFRLDVLYYIFYYGGFYHVLLFIPLYAVLLRLTRTYAPSLQLNLSAGLHPAWQIAIAVLVFDFFGYWIHRIKHANSFLWAFHAIHHSQQHLTVMTNYRFHIVDETLLRLALFIPFQIIGGDVKVWIAVDLAMAWILLLQHTEWNWTYGLFGRLFVSPRFHQIHHSAEPQHQNRNFGMLLPVWDDWFGTAERKAVATTYGLGPDGMPETFLGQLVWPFTRIMRGWRSEPAAPIATPALKPDR